MRAATAICAATVALVLGGCAGYQLGPVNGQVAAASSVQITPFANKTIEPRLGDALTTALRKELQRDGTYRLATGGDGDIEVSGVITEYQRLELSFVPNDIVTAQDYRLRMTAQVMARERATGKVLLSRPVTGYTMIRVGSDLPGVEKQALPLLATDLAKQVIALLADGSW